MTTDVVFNFHMYAYYMYMNCLCALIFEHTQEHKHAHIYPGPTSTGVDHVWQLLQMGQALTYPSIAPVNCHLVSCTRVCMTGDCQGASGIHADCTQRQSLGLQFTKKSEFNPGGITEGSKYIKTQWHTSRESILCVSKVSWRCTGETAGQISGM